MTTAVPNSLQMLGANGHKSVAQLMKPPYFALADQEHAITLVVL